MPRSRGREPRTGSTPPAPAMKAEAGLVAELERWRRQNEEGGWACRWRRRSVWAAQLAQRAGWHRLALAPLFFGQGMWVLTGEAMSSGLLTFGYTELALTSLMLRVIKPGDFVVDVGAHFGYESLLASHLVGERGRVLSFEPSPDALRLAIANLGGRGNVELTPAAVGDSEGVAYLEHAPIHRSAFTRASSSGHGGGGVPVPMTTLDAVLRASSRPARFLKCDVEGGEETVLRGARELLRRDAPLLVLEADIPAAGGRPSERAAGYAEFLGPLGYTGYSFDYDGRFRVAPLGALCVGHANVAFAAASDRHLLESLDGG